MSKIRRNKTVTKLTEKINNLKTELEHQRSSMKPHLLKEASDAHVKAERANAMCESMEKQLRKAEDNVAGLNRLLEVERALHREAVQTLETMTGEQALEA